MNRKDRRKLEREGKIPKAEPTFQMKPSAMVDAVLDGGGKDIIMAEIDKRILERERQAAIDLDTVAIWVLYTKYGWGKERLKKFYSAMFEEHYNMRQHYEIDDLYPERYKLKEKGIDVEAWYDELFAADGAYKKDLEENNGLSIRNN